MKTCTIKNCNKKVFAKNLCCKHYNQIRRHGKIIQTRFDDNEIIVYPNHAEIIIRNANSNNTIKAIIDNHNLNKVKVYKWYADYVNNSHYILTSTPNGKLYLSTLIYGKQIPVGHYIVYKNKNTLDNRESNLIIQTRQEMQRSTTIFKNNTSGHKGIIMRKRNGKWTGKWTAKITHNYKTHYLGDYDTIEEAIQVRDKAKEKFNWE